MLQEITRASENSLKYRKGIANEQTHVSVTMAVTLLCYLPSSNLESPLTCFQILDVSFAVFEVLRELHTRCEMGEEEALSTRRYLSTFQSWSELKRTYIHADVIKKRARGDYHPVLFLLFKMRNCHADTVIVT